MAFHSRSRRWSALSLGLLTIAGCAAPVGPSVPVTPQASSTPAAAVATPSPAPSAAALKTLSGKVTFRGEPLVGATLVAYDALTDQPIAIGLAPKAGYRLQHEAEAEAPAPTASASPAAAPSPLALTAASLKTDATGAFQLQVSGLEAGRALRLVAVTESGRAALQTIVFGDAASAYRTLADGAAIGIDEVTTTVAQVQRAPLAALNGLESGRLAQLIGQLSRQSAPLASALAETFKQQPHLANTAVAYDGGDAVTPAEAAAVLGIVQASPGANQAAIQLVAEAVAGAATAPRSLPLPANLVFVGTVLAGKPDASGALSLVDSRTGTAIDVAKGGAAAVSAAINASVSSGGGGSSASQPFTVAEGEPVTLRFRGMVGGQSLVTSAAADTDGRTFTRVGKDAQTVRPFDFRFYAHDFELVKADNSTVPLTLSAGDWQYQNLALIDLEGGYTALTNDVVTGTAPAGTYTGIRFKVGVPQALNHLEGASAPHAILRSDGDHATGMLWSWLGGRKYAKIEFAVPQADSSEKKFYVHLGGTGATNPTKQDGTYVGFDPLQTVLASPNVAQVAIGAFNPSTDLVVADLKAFLADINLAEGGSYMPAPMSPSGGNATNVVLKAFGLAGGEQQLFRKGR